MSDNNKSIEREVENSENEDLLQELKKIVSQSIEENTDSIQDKIISGLAKKTVYVLVTVAFSTFIIFGGLTYFISATKENIELKGQVERRNIQLERCNHDLHKQQNNNIK